MIVRITDEFQTVWTFETDSVKEIVELVGDWLENRDSTPIYEINIEVDPLSC